MSACRFECDICVSKCAISKKVECLYCNQSACRVCYETYTLSITNEPQCMFCNKTWTKEYVDENFTKVFINKGLKKHRENVLLDMEKAMLPQTQPMVEREKERRKIQSKVSELKEKQKKLWNELRVINQELRTNYNNIWRLDNTNVETSNIKREFVRKCPKEECKGFLSRQWKCGLCESKVCKDCNEIITDEEHECDENNKATVAMLAKDTKPCPSCGTMIFKISGCAQIWCTDCHTAFNWSTGRIETGTIHNPHYFEFMRNQNITRRNPYDIVCGGLPEISEINILSYMPTMFKTINFLNFYRLMTHVENVEFRIYNVTDDNFATNQDLRISFMLNDINEEKFATMLQRREKKRKMNREYFQIMQMLHNTGCEYMRQLYEEKLSQYLPPDFITKVYEYTQRRRFYGRTQNTQDFESYLIKNEKVIQRIEYYHNIFNELQKYVNNALINVGTRYKCSYPNINKNFTSIEIKNN